MYESVCTSRGPWLALIGLQGTALRNRFLVFVLRCWVPFISTPHIYILQSTRSSRYSVSAMEASPARSGPLCRIDGVSTRRARRPTRFYFYESKTKNLCRRRRRPSMFLCLWSPCLSSKPQRNVDAQSKSALLRSTLVRLRLLFRNIS